MLATHGRRPGSALTVALVGCGRWGCHILRDLRSLGCDVTVVARSEASSARAAKEGATRIVERVEEIDSVDGIVVATPTSTHADVVEKLLAFGVPVFVEKPFTNDPQRADELASRAPDRLFVMDKWRYHPAVRVLSEIATSGELGAVTGLVTRREQWGNPHVDTDSVWTLAPHDLAASLEILGALPSPRSAVLERVDGQVMGMTAMLGEDPWVGISVSGAAPAHYRSMRLLCEGGTAWFADGWADHVLVATADTVGSEPQRRAAEGELPLLAELRAFVEHLGGGAPPASDAHTGALVVRLIAELRALGGEASGQG